VELTNYKLVRTSDRNVGTAAQLAYGKGMAIPGENKVHGWLEHTGCVTPSLLRG